LQDDTYYSAIISVTDANGVTTGASSTFDTINPSYVFEAEDWDHDSGKYIDNPQVNKYAGLASVSGVDFNNASPGSGSAVYRPQGMETEVAGDQPRLAYIGTTNVDYDIGYGTPGGFANYTRHYPAGLYNVYARLADGNGSQTDTASMSVVAGTGQFLGTGPFTFNVQSTGWQTYKFYPLLDANNALAQFTNDGSATTIQLLSDGGSYNANFFIFVPANTNVSTGGATASFANFYPDGTLQFQNTNSLNFTVSSSAGISPGNVTVQLIGTNLLGQGVVKTYTTANGLNITGPSTLLNVTAPLSSNTTYSAFVQVIDLDGNPSSLTTNFDTVIPFYAFEAEDFDYNNGQDIENPQTNSYDSLDGVEFVDYYVDNPTSGNHSYRQVDTSTGPETETASDVARAAYTNDAAVDIIGNPIVDYDVGYNDSPNWENYTRRYPAGTYNVFMRCASGGGGGSCGLARVTAGVGTSNQTVVNLGTFVVPNTGNWQKYAFSPLKDNNGNLVKVTFDGTSKSTLRVFGPSGCNANFYLLQPADTTLPVISGLYPDGTSLFQQTSTLSFSVASSDGINPSGISVTLNGTPAAGLTVGGTSTSRTVSYTGLQPNTVYNVVISVHTIAGNSSSLSYTFDTYPANTYQFEAADYDYTSNGVSGLYFDNPQIDRYNGLDAAPGIDEQEVTGGAPLNEDVYRPSPDGSTILVCTQSGGDVARAQFGSNPSWRINWFGYGDFCNYTRHYPAGSYNIVGRFTEGGANSSATLYKVTAGLGTADQTTNLLGVFNIPLVGWNAWNYATLVDSGGTPVVVTFDGSKQTLRLAGPLADDGQTINAGFFMLLPVSGSSSHGPTVTATIAGGNINISFPTVTGSSYQVVYKNALTSGAWTTLGSPITGNNAVQSVQFPTTGSQRFYQIQVQ
jgi:hypothetical protein